MNDKNPMKKLLLILSFTLGLTTAASANTEDFVVGDVFFCDTIKSVGWVWNDEKQFKNYRPEKFKFSIADEKTIKFGSGGSFDDFEMEIKGNINSGFPILRAQSSVSTFTLSGSKFIYTSALPQAGELTTAICDRF